MPASRRVFIFAPTQEWTNLLIPLAFVAMIFFFERQEVPSSLSLWFPFIGAVFGLNIIHNAFTLLLFDFPEIKKWMNENRAYSRFDQPKFLLLTCLAIFIFFQIFMFSIEGAFSTWPIYWKVGFGIMAYFQTAHALWQNHGLSVLYNHAHLQQNIVNENDLKKYRRIERVEKYFFRTFCYLFPLTAAFYSGLMAGGWANFLMILTGIACLGLFLLTCLYPKVARSNKIFYQLRLFMYPLTFHHPLSFVGLHFMHGYEYWGVYSKMFTNSAIERSLKTAMRVMIITFLVFLLIPFRTYIAEQIPFFKNLFSPFPRFLLTELAAFSFSLTFIHYFLDSRLYHFSDPNNRQHISPLLK